MIPLTTAYQTQIQAALARGQKANLTVTPKVQRKNYGEYEVTSASGNGPYIVTIEPDELNVWVIDCPCKAGRNGLACQHSALVKEAHKAFLEAGKAPATPDYDSPEYQAKLAKDKADLFG